MRSYSVESNTSNVKTELPSFKNESLDKALHLDNPLEYEDYMNDKKEPESVSEGLSYPQTEDVHNEIENYLTTTTSKGGGVYHAASAVGQDVDKNRVNDLENLFVVS